MSITLAVAAMCLSALVFETLFLAARHRPDSWLASEVGVLVVGAPLAFALAAFGAGVLAWVALHSSLADAGGADMIGSVMVVGAGAIVLRRIGTVMRRGPGAVSSVQASPASVQPAAGTGTTSPA